jgi:hypothetical protein
MSDIERRIRVARTAGNEAFSVTLVSPESLAGQNGRLAVLRIGAGGKPPVHQDGADSAELASTVIVHETTCVPSEIIQALQEAERLGFDARDPHRPQTSHVSEERKPLIAERDRQEQAQSAFVGAFLGCLTTLAFAAVGIVPGIASALAAALLGGMLLLLRPTRLAAGSFFSALYGGTFGGMTQIPWLSDYATAHSGSLANALFISLSMVCGLSLSLVTMLDARSVVPIAFGFGGRLGAIAAVASFFLAQLAGLSENAAGHSIAVAGALSISLSIVCGLAFLVVSMLDARSARPIAFGYGGRLGAIAAVASFSFVQLLGLFGADSSRFHGSWDDVVSVEPRVIILGFLACLLGMIGTSFVVRLQFAALAGVAVRIFVASAFASCGLMALDLISSSNGPMLGAFYAGCFLGMSSPERIKGQFQAVFAAFVLTAVLVVVRALLPGVGGGLGLAAFVSVAFLVALRRVTAWTTRLVRARDAGIPSFRGGAPSRADAVPSG